MSGSLSRFVSLLNSLPDLSEARILELGCGDGSGLIALRMRYPTAFICGIDYDDSALHSARKAAACRVMADIQTLPFSKPFALIVIRHPDIDRFPAVWEHAVKSASILLGDSGLLVVTCYSVAEAEQIDGWLKVWFPKRDTPLGLAPTGGVGRDRFVFVRQKNDPIRSSVR